MNEYVRKPDQAATALRAAMKAGYANIPAIRANPNFQTALSNKNFKALLQVQTTSAVRLEAMNGFGGARTPDPKRNTLTLTNDSAFPLTNVKIQLEVYSGNVATPVSKKTLTVERITPGQSVVLNGAATPPASSAFVTPKVASKMTLTCDQVPANTPVRQNPTTEFK